jgi:hypothetical protein
MEHPLKEVPYLQVQCYSEHPEVYHMANQLVESFLSTKERLHKDKYVKSARKLIASIWLRPSDLFRFSTTTGHFGKQRKQVWMSQEVLTLFKHMRDRPFPLVSLVAPAIAPAMAKDGQGRSAVYARTSEFMNQLKSLTVRDVVFDPDAPRITLKVGDDKKGVYQPIPEQVKEEKWYRYTEETLKRHAALLAASNIAYETGELLSITDLTYNRRFRNSLEKTGRFYSSFVNQPKTVRNGILFNGESAISIDFSGLHPHLILRLVHGKDIHTRVGLFGLTTEADPYKVPGFDHLDRDIHKQLINSLFNAKDRDSAWRALNAAYYWKEKEKQGLKVKIYSGKGKREGQKAFPGNKEEAEKYIESFANYSPDLAVGIATGLGNVLQKIDSDIMLVTMRLCTDSGIPVLPVHDEVVVPRSRFAEVAEILKRAFSTVLKESGAWGTVPIKVSALGEEPVRTRLTFNGSELYPVGT